MKPFLLRRYTLAAIVVALLGVGAYLLRDQWDRGTAGEIAAEGTRSTAAESDSPAAEVSPESAESIAFPREMWEAAGLRVEPVGKGEMNEQIELTGKIALNEDRLAHVFPLVEGRVDDVKVRFGQRVKQGELLVVVQSKEVGQGMLQLYQDRLKLEFAQARNSWTQEVGQNTLAMIGMMREAAPVEQIEQSLKDRTMGDYRQQLMTAYVEFLRAQKLLERLSPLSESGAVAGRQLVEAQAELDAARATLQSLWEQISQDTVQASRLSQQNVKELQTNIAVAETNLKILGFEDKDLQEIDPAEQGEQLAHYPVTAPFDGTVISKDVVLLERVGPERQILTIADLSTVWVTADIYDTHLPLLARLSDQTLKVRCEAWPDRTFEARIFYTGDVVQESTRTIALRAAAENTERLLKPGMFVTVELPGLDTAQVLQVPRPAILEHEGASFVFVQTGEGQFVRRDVTLGRQTRQVVEILSGLEQNERVVVDGGFALKSKMLADLLEE